MLTIGNITLTGVSWATVTIARSWSSSRSASASASRMPAHAQERVRLRRPGARRQRLVAAHVEGAQGQASPLRAPRPSRDRPRPAPRPSAGRGGRGTGTRCGPARRGRHRSPRAARASATRPEVGADQDLDAVARSRPARARPARPPASARARSSAARRSWRRLGAGSTKTAPSDPSRATVTPGADDSTAAPAATTAGIARDRARIARDWSGFPRPAPARAPWPGRARRPGRAPGRPRPARPHRRCAQALRRPAREPPAGRPRARRPHGSRGRGPRPSELCLDRRRSRRPTPGVPRAPASIRARTSSSRSVSSSSMRWASKIFASASPPSRAAVGADPLDLATNLGDRRPDPSPLGRDVRRRLVGDLDVGSHAA